MKSLIVFVGDKPSSKNIDPGIPFIGTPSHSNLMKWIDKMCVGEYFLVNSHSEADKMKICRLEKDSPTWIALGNNASKVLSRFDIPHYKLPHPSPRNRLLNDKNYIDKELEKCNNYINETGVILK